MERGEPAAVQRLSRLFARRAVVRRKEPRENVEGSCFEVRANVEFSIGEDGVITDIVELPGGQHEISGEQPGAPLVVDWVLPGFVDIHTHGRGLRSSLETQTTETVQQNTQQQKHSCLGAHAQQEVLEEWLSPVESLRFAARQGATTSVLATVTFPSEDLDPGGAMAKKITESLRSFLSRTDHGGAVIMGVHCEGPIVRDLGGLVPSDTAMSLRDFRRFLDVFGPGNELLKVMTIAPSCDAGSGKAGEGDVDGEEAYGRIRELRRRGITCSLGHDRQASEEEILGALRLQTSDWRMHVTHIMNVQKLHHREAGLANFGLVQRYPDLPEFRDVLWPPTVEVVGDLVHVHALALELLLSSRVPEDVCMISDSVLGHAHSDGEDSTDGGLLASCTYGGRAVRVSHPPGGRPHVVVKGKDCSDIIAGSCVTMLDMFFTVKDTLRKGVIHASTVCSLAPARVARIENTVGALGVGMRADFAIFSGELHGSGIKPAEDAAGRNMKHTATVVAGAVVWSASGSAKLRL